MKTTKPKKILLIDNLPDDQWHGWKWLKHDQEGNLYFNIGAPCNNCLSNNPQYASILKFCPLYDQTGTSSDQFHGIL